MVKLLLPVQGCDRSERQVFFREVDIFNAKRDAALIQASTNGHVNVMKELIHSGANVNWQGGLGCIAIVAATKFGHVKAVQELLNAKANVNAEDGNGRIALSVAMLLCDVDIIRELLMTPGIDVSDINFILEKSKRSMGNILSNS